VFLESAPVFSLDELAVARGGVDQRTAARNQLKRYLRSGRILAVAREIYARVPPGLDPERFVPDPFLVAFAACPQGVFAYHSALELLGVAHSVWSEHTLHGRQRRSPIRVGSFRVRFLPTPTAIARRRAWSLGTRQVPRSTRQLVVTGPERTLVEGLRRPELAGGLDELLDSVAGLPLLDFELLERLLAVYAEKSLWAATGWLAERLTGSWSTPTRFLDRCRRHRPRQNQYLVRNARGGKLVQPWRLIVPEHLREGGGEGAANR
jgi:predicted transcriptional regulator of viral defense system